MQNINYTQVMVSYLIVGLIDSDGCLTWSWNKNDNAFVPSVSITLKLNRNILIFVKNSIGGYVTQNGNWQHKTIRAVSNVCLPILFMDWNDPSSCKLMTSRRYDALIFFHIMTTVVLNEKRHLKPEGKAILVDMRRFLHFGKTRSGGKTPSELEAQLRLPQESTTDCAKTKAKELQQAFELQIQREKSKVMNGSYLNEWQVVGFFLGDGGVHVIWGTQVITTTIDFTGDRRSAVGLELYAASLIRDGVSRKAWQSSRKDTSRLIIHGVELFTSSIEPFFQQYPMPNCKKREIFHKICETSRCLVDLRTKQSKGQPWSPQDWSRLFDLIQATWVLNPSGKDRKFQSPKVYLAHLKSIYFKGKLNIR